MLGKVLDQFNEVFSRFVPNRSVWFEFYITAKEQEQEIVSIQNLFFLKKQLSTWDHLRISIVISPKHEINSSV